MTGLGSCALKAKSQHSHFRHSSQLLVNAHRFNSVETLKEDSTSSTRGFIPRYAFDERTCRARESRRRRSDRAETQQRLGAPSLGSGKLQTPPNRYPPARLLSLLFGAKPA